MSEQQQSNEPPIQLPIAPSAIRSVALDELDRADAFVQSLDLKQWKSPSKASGWSVGDVVTHLGLTMALYGRVLDAATAGRTAGGLWKAVGRIGKQVAPAMSPALNALNKAVPRVIDRTLAPEVIQGQFTASARTLRAKIHGVEAEDFTRPIHYMGSPWPLSFFLAGLVNELALHCWDAASVLDSTAGLSEQARAVIPLYFWSGTSLMLRVPKGKIGTVQILLENPQAEMWWRLREVEPAKGMGRVERPDVTITGTSAMYCLAISGRVALDDAIHATSVRADGDRQLGEDFMMAWKIV